MAQAWRDKDESEFQCSQCGAVYEVSLARLSLCLQAEAICEVCLKVMNDWRGNLAPTYRLKRPPDRPPSFH